MTLEARGVWLTSGAPSKRLVWCVQSQDQTASIHTLTSCVSTYEHTTHMKPNRMRTTPPAGLISSWSLINNKCAKCLIPKVINSDVCVCVSSIFLDGEFTDLETVGGSAVTTVTDSLVDHLRLSTCLSCGNHGNWPQH